MKTISPQLQAHLDRELTTLAYLVKITRKDGAEKGFTTHDRDLTIDSVTYKAENSLTPSAIESSAGLSVDNLDITGALSSEDITDADIAAGLYDFARIDVYACNWSDLSQGAVHLRRGWMGQVARIGNSYTAEVRGLHDLLQRPVGDYYTPECRFDLGDCNCGVALSSYSGNVTNVIDSLSFCDAAQSAADGALDYGKLTWVTGENAGQSADVKKWDADAKQFTLWLPAPNPIKFGDAYSVCFGCDKRFSTCKNKFANAANFGGFPHVPGVGNILKYPV